MAKAAGAAQVLFIFILWIIAAGAAPAQYPKCAVVAGYTNYVNFVTDAGTGGTDLGPYADLASATGACDTNADCRGIATTGDGVFWQKLGYDIVPSRVLNGACLYVKLRTVCPPLRGYTAVSDVDTAGSQMGTYAMLNEAKTYCESSGICEGISSYAGGFSFVLRGSAVKTAEGYMVTGEYNMTYSRGKCFHIKVDTQCPDVAGYIPNSDSSYLSFPIMTVTPKQVLATCNANETCMGFDSNGQITGIVDGYYVYSRNTCCYDKANTTSCPEISGYVAMIDKDLASKVISTFQNQTAAVAACSADQKCAGFNNRWITRSNPTGANYVYAYGTCFYVKST